MVRSVKRRDADPFAPPEPSPAIRDDPFARAALDAAKGGTGPIEPTDTLLRPLAALHPDARTTTAVLLDAAISVDDLLRRARGRGFAAGFTIGALLAAGVASALWWARMR
jgi:hypothetical protein